MLAAAAMSLSSVSVIANALRLRTFRVEVDGRAPGASVASQGAASPAPAGSTGTN
jgi:hypothetical protein